ncbi:16S rRNA (guanine(527)-N(7))-methyltransferase RsmG [Paracoccus nototheniae]|uniref:Ribosomal RNA small subunit methyltransferase G n=1 Tax=Paracoccus nototheniae TaxID=2489002 RepID=A0ABW4DVF8_9RHOB|nr:16S rRNA (guanine(527)-N(7))-methyltransferase RsmG [Paracoccus nototheniae]
MTNVSRETENLLLAYQSLVAKWNPKINLVAASTIPDFRFRHIQDSLQLVALADPSGGHWVDLGSGGGLPGIVIGIMTAGSALTVHLVESDQRKAAFLRTVVRELELHQVTVLSERIESTEPSRADHLSARALAPLPKLLEMAERHLKPGGTAWLMKGRTWKAECEQASVDWRFDFAAYPSRTDPEAAILKVTGVSHA